eukprot:TRINITY_DN1120_c1_g2_i2.p1 TRINITY_DN1120_c1_g2~~TRINITY_DN1120_c1_g2_i2.p1  ORF type:complete len:514 (-),score=121.81 TRINITY_DN1120_c1_g2_i2:1148-2689(-)
MNQLEWKGKWKEELLDLLEWFSLHRSREEEEKEEENIIKEWFEQGKLMKVIKQIPLNKREKEMKEILGSIIRYLNRQSNLKEITSIQKSKEGKNGDYSIQFNQVDSSQFCPQWNSQNPERLLKQIINFIFQFNSSMNNELDENNLDHITLSKAINKLLRAFVGEILLLFSSLHGSLVVDSFFMDSDDEKVRYWNEKKEDHCIIAKRIRILLFQSESGCEYWNGIFLDSLFDNSFGIGRSLSIYWSFLHNITSFETCPLSKHILLQIHYECLPKILLYPSLSCLGILSFSALLVRISPGSICNENRPSMQQLAQSIISFMVNCPLDSLRSLAYHSFCLFISVIELNESILLLEETIQVCPYSSVSALLLYQWKNKIEVKTKLSNGHWHSSSQFLVQLLERKEIMTMPDLIMGASNTLLWLVIFVKEGKETNKLLLEAIDASKKLDEQIDDQLKNYSRPLDQQESEINEAWEKLQIPKGDRKHIEDQIASNTNQLYLMKSITQRIIETSMNKILE